MKNIQSEFLRLIDNGNNKRSKQMREVLLNAFERGLQTVMPEQLVENSIHLTGTQLQISSRISSQKAQYELMDFSNALIIGGGKATAGIVNAVIQKIGEILPCYGSINIPKGQEEQWGESLAFTSLSGIQNKIDIVYASHPIPDENGIKGTKKIIDLVTNASTDTLVIVVISGGGSALMPLPKKPITISALKALNETLLKSGANIEEVNSIRKHVSDFKGGQLATHIYPRTGIGLIVSDVRGDLLDAIASGPTTHDTSTFSSAWLIIEKYRIVHVVPESIRVVLRKGVNGLLGETPKQNHRVFTKFTNMIIGSASMAVSEIKNVLEGEGFQESRTSSPEMVGEAKNLGEKLGKILTGYAEPPTNKIFYINSGECTVSIKGNGIGGRNQEMLLAFVQNLLKNPKIKFRFLIASIAFDGIEGNSEAAGALVDNDTLKSVKTLSLDPSEFLSQNNSFAFFKELEHAIEIGQTGTNVNDIYCLVVEPKD